MSIEEPNCCDGIDPYCVYHNKNSKKESHSFSSVRGNES